MDIPTQGCHSELEFWGVMPGGFGFGFPALGCLARSLAFRLSRSPGKNGATRAPQIPKVDSVSSASMPGRASSTGWASRPSPSDRFPLVAFLDPFRNTAIVRPRRIKKGSTGRRLLRSTRFDRIILPTQKPVTRRTTDCESAKARHSLDRQPIR